MLAAARTGEVDLEPGWGQGRATFGGVVAALAVSRLQAAVADPDQPLRSLTVSFVAPLAPGPVTATAEVLRRGRSVTQAQGALIQDGQVAAAVLASFGAARDSVLALPGPARPDLPDPTSIEPNPFLPGLTPDFFAHVDLRMATGSIPFTGAAHPDVSGWMRYRKPPREFGTAHLVGLIDAWPPSVLALLTKPAASSTLSWTLELFGETTGGPEDFWCYRVVTDRCDAGYCHSQAGVWGPSGEPVAVSRQVIAVFA